MALSIKTAEVDELVRSPARVTGESVTEAVTAALREGLTHPIARQEWDGAAGDDGRSLSNPVLWSRSCLANRQHRHY